MSVYFCRALSSQYEKVLIYRFIRKRCLLSVYKIIFSYAKIIFNVSHKFNNFNISFSDVFTEGLIGFFNAVLLYNPEKNCRLSNFFFLWVNFSILSYLKKYLQSSDKKKILFNINDYNYFKFQTIEYLNNINIYNSPLYFYNYDSYYKLYKIKSAIYNLLPLLQIIIFSMYIFRRLLSLEELSFFLNISIKALKRLKRNTLYVLCILSI